MHQTKPSKIKTLNDLHDFYWLKSILIKFCSEHQLSIQGSKFDLIKRIEIFLSTGISENYKSIKKSENRDSIHTITRNTRVINYNNDALTRNFFVSEVGLKFKFNDYLRQFTRNENITPGLTYGELVKGWIIFENNKKSNTDSNGVSKQFEYNQFIKDYFNNEKNGTLKKAIAVWKSVISYNGPNTYSYFKTQKKLNGK